MMRLKFSAAMHALLLVIGCAGISLSNYKQGSRSHGFQVTAKLAQEQKGKAIPGKPIVLTVELKNISKRSLPMFRTNVLYDYTIRVRDGNGREVGLTEFGARRVRDAGAYFSREQFDLAPESRIEDVIDINGMYNLTAPGRYHVSFTRLVPMPDGKGWMEITSNVVEVKPLN